MNFVFTIVSLFLFLLCNGQQRKNYIFVGLSDSTFSWKSADSLRKWMQLSDIKTINGASILGNGNLVVSGATAWGAISGTLANQSDLQTVLNTKQSSIAQGSTLQYFRGDFSLSTFPTTTASFASSLNKNFVTDAQLVIVDNISGVNTGDNSANSTYANDYRLANFVSGINYLSPNGNGSSLTGLTKTQVGLGNLDNTSDASKPVSTAEQTALNLKANIASPTFTGTVAGITATMVGLGNVTNESKATMFTSPTFTGTVTLPASTSLTTPVIGVATGTSLAATGAITSNGTAGIGYAVGSGGTISQLTSKSTTVILNKLCGNITTNNAALAAATIVTFTVTNSTVAANDIIVVQHDSGGTIGAYTLSTNTSAAGSFKISIRNNTAGSLGEALVIKYIVIKAAIN